jgi:nickel superoxide dismutase
MKRTSLAIATIFLVSLTASKALSHCQLPCGIYDDPARFKMMEEHIATIEKAMNTIVELSAQEHPNYNQLVRWVDNKDQHADELSEIVTYYFMAQRITPREENDEARAKYIEEISSLHKMLIYAMKAKQTTDLANVEKLRVLLTDFKSTYLAE